MNKETTDFLVRWAWIPLLVICVILLGRFLDRRAELQVLLRQSDELARQAVALRERAAVKPVLTATIPDPVPLAKPAKPAPPQIRSWFSDRNALGDPEYGPIVARRHRRYAMANYREAIDALDLPAADKAHVKELAVSWWMALQDAGDIVDRMDGATTALRNEAQKLALAEPEAQMKTFLGEEGFAKLETGRDQSGQQTMNWGLYTAFWDAGLGLTTAQKESVARAAQQANAPYAKGEQPVVDPLTGLNEADRGLRQAAGAFLSPEQWEFLQKEQEADNRYEQAREATRRRKEAASSKGR